MIAQLVVEQNGPILLWQSIHSIHVTTMIEG